MKFFNKKQEIKTLPFSDQLNVIKGQFKIAHEGASNLHSKMEQEIKSKELQIASLQSDIEIINTTKKETETFMENISKFI